LQWQIEAFSGSTSASNVISPHWQRPSIFMLFLPHEPAVKAVAVRIIPHGWLPRKAVTGRMIAGIIENVSHAETGAR
jgi:hypothetical protein